MFSPVDFTYHARKGIRTKLPLSKPWPPVEMTAPKVGIPTKELRSSALKACEKISALEVALFHVEDMKEEMNKIKVMQATKIDLAGYVMEWRNSISLIESLIKEAR